MKVLIVGYGSIGRRHAGILAKNKKISEIVIYTKQKIKKFYTINNKKEIIKYKPDYVVISNENQFHYKFLLFFEKNFKNIFILVEKPLFHNFTNFRVKNNFVFVGYNLRFHPFIIFLKKIVLNRKIWSVIVTTGSYLPKWKKNINYTNSYSAQKKSGGVLLDLSHEIDYIYWLFGDFKPIFSVYKKISDLKIKSKDNLFLTGKGKNKFNIQLNLNYFFKIPMRQILIDGKNLSVNVDLISNTMHVINYTKSQKYKLNNFHINTMYENQHNEIIYNKMKNVCTFDEGKKTLEIIDKIIKISV
jgi:CMP-N,N'-diacetyllegionaminic acid synthase